MRRRLMRAFGAAAAAAGVLMRVGPGVAGPVLVATGVAMIYLPAGVIALGVVLWLADWRMP